MSETVVKTCVSCKHFSGSEAEPYMANLQGLVQQQGPECKAPGAKTRDMVLGKAYCRAERNDKKGCGPTGKLWVSKN